MNTKDIERLVRSEILAMTPYSTARDECEGSPEIFLDANENPYDNGFNRYPDPHQKALKRQIAKVKGIGENRIFIGNGSDEAIDIIYRIFCRPGTDNAVSISPTYGMYSVAAAINGTEFRKVPLMQDFSLDETALLAATDENTKLIFICSPNNPTGNSFPKEQLTGIAGTFNGIVVVDEAYIDFSVHDSLTGVLDRYPNLVILQTFSKAWGMAGLRVGMAFASPYIIRLMSNVKYPYNINGLTQEIVIGRLGQGRPDTAVTVRERERISSAISAYPGIIYVYPSDANFILVKCSDAEGLYTELIRNRIIVRDRSRVPGCEGCLRISVGTPEENTRLICAVDEWSSRLSSSRPGALSSGNGIPVSVNTLDTEDEAGLPAEKRAGDPARKAAIFRTTSETAITAIIDLDGKGPSFISTGIGFFDHMLDQIVHHGGISMLIYARGDLNVDEHHTIEDVAITLGKAVSDALGSKAGIGRYGFVLPMDESDASVLLDLGGRIDFRWDAGFAREKIGDMPTEMFSHFFKSFAESARCNLHISARGENEHHKIEGIFKAFARALKMAIARDGSSSLPSSKGIL